MRVYNVLQILNNNAFVNREGHKPRYVILHGTGGGKSAQGIAAYFASTQRSDNPVSANYVIGTDGTIVCCNPEEDGAYANGYLSQGHDVWWNPAINPNDITISVEHCKASSDNSDALTPEQQDASFHLILDICQRWNIPMRLADSTGGITSHASIDPVNRSRCPGDYPWDALWAFLQNNANTKNGSGGGDDMAVDINDPTIQAWFTQDGDRLVRKDNPKIFMFGGSKNGYLQFGGIAVCGLPIACEFYLPQYPNTAILPCERVLIVYDPDRKIDNPPIKGPCYLMHINGGAGLQFLAQSLETQLHQETDKENADQAKIEQLIQQLSVIKPPASTAVPPASSVNLVDAITTIKAIQSAIPHLLQDLNAS